MEFYLIGVVLFAIAMWMLNGFAYFMLTMGIVFFISGGIMMIEKFSIWKYIGECKHKYLQGLEGE